LIFQSAQTPRVLSVRQRSPMLIQRTSPSSRNEKPTATANSPPAAGTLALPGIGLIPVLGAVGDEGSSPAADTGPLRAAFGVIDQDPEGAAVAVAAHRLDDLVDLVALGLEVTDVVGEVSEVLAAPQLA
jgi:hypothetical protein